MAKNSSILAQRYFDGRSLLRYLPLFKLIKDTHNSKAASQSCS
jgi:hypothetical protein